jgi:hypothetical protein
MVLGSALSAYGGWKGVDSVLDKRRQQGVDSELEESRKQFRMALRGETAKQAADGEAPATDIFENLFNQFEKVATAGDWLGKSVGTYATGASLAALLAGYQAYDYGVKNQRRTVLENAIKLRQAQRHASQPSPLYLTHADEEESTDVVPA